MTIEQVNNLIKKINAFINELNDYIGEMQQANYRGAELQELINMRNEEIKDLEYFINKRNWLFGTH